MKSVKLSERVSITGWLFYLNKVFGRINGLFCSGISDRINALLVVAGNLQEAVRKDVQTGEKEILIAQLIARFVAAANHFYNLPLGIAMCIKFPLKGCLACGQSECNCPPERRAEYRKDMAYVHAQESWSLQQWQELLAHRYGRGNAERGIHDALGRLFREITEILQLTAPGANIGETVQEIETKLAQEFADVLAWILALATMLQIDAEAALRALYSKGCNCCGREQCNCAKHLTFGPAGPIRVESRPVEKVVAQA